MRMEIYAHKEPSGVFVLLGENGEKFTKRSKVGQDVLFSAKIPRNSKFHRKLITLLTFAFNNWECPEIEFKGKKVTKSFNRFRKDLVIQAGFWQPVMDIKGEVRAEADSISYAKCSQEKAEQIYYAVLDVVSSQIFKGGYSPEKLDILTEEWLRFN